MSAEQYRATSKDGHQLESEVLTQVRQMLRLFGWFVVRLQAGPLVHKGLSDLVAIRGGRTVWVECKSTRGKQSDHQKAFQADVEAAGGEYRVVRTVEEIADLRRLEE
jgi:Holliday junction resolvase